MKPEAVVNILEANGGKIAGKTRLQKTAYFLEAKGLGFGFDFNYHYYGPYSEDLAIAARDAVALGLILSRSETSSVGASYSIYEIAHEIEPQNNQRLQLQKEMLTKLANYDTTSLELAATADFLERKGFKPDPWSETQRRKSLKASPERITKAKRLLNELHQMERP